ncbi:hypothetical protein FHS18_001925 [Paenibacillus phyllosphaerae]|uniref:Hydrolase n=1 Tax=Paenibacillus phyllosphaerae TaxID=274593 RepID=A0A7W5AWG4_9BACL|nr:hypothetical protein [Paenibacillus phyllosphaerae]MBB3109862.1 hypothetical protein [Paenibacillus phyllosphaerae]
MFDPHENIQREEAIHPSEDAVSLGRKTYYVSVQAGSVLEDPTAASFELEIRANEEEIDQLQELFDDIATEDESEFIHFHKHPYGSKDTDHLSDGVDNLLVDVYKLLYELGTPETRVHIAKMGLFKPTGYLS